MNATRDDSEQVLGANNSQSIATQCPADSCEED